MNIRLITLIALNAALIFILTGCSEPEVVTVGPPDIPIEQLLSYPDTVLIDGKHLWLDTYMWRDFMPISPPGSKPLIALMLITEIDSVTIPSSITSDAVWIVYNNEVWKSWFTNETHPPYGPHILPRVARDGPKWGPCDSCASAVVRIFDSNNTAHFLLAKDQNIGATSLDELNY